MSIKPPLKLARELACPLLQFLSLSWWLGFRIALDGWSKSCRLAGEICSGHGGIKSRETSVARNWRWSGPCQFQGCTSGVELAMKLNRRSQHTFRSDSEIELMSASSDAIARRFGDGGPYAEGAEDNELIRRVLSRKTVRRYSDKMPGDELLDLLVACALSASAKSDFQQVSILRVRDPAEARRDRRVVSEHAVDRDCAGVLCVPGRCKAAAACRRNARQAGSRTERLRDSSTPASMPPLRCRP